MSGILFFIFASCERLNYTVTGYDNPHTLSLSDTNVAYKIIEDEAWEFFSHKFNFNGQLHFSTKYVYILLILEISGFPRANYKKQNRTKQSKTKQKQKQNKTKQNKTKQNKTKQIKTKQNKTTTKEKTKETQEPRFPVQINLNKIWISKPLYRMLDTDSGYKFRKSLQSGKLVGISNALVGTNVWILEKHLRGKCLEILAPL